MIDLHSHILPNIDDGSKSVEMSYKMLELLGQQGVDTVAATPHFYPNRHAPESFLSRRQAAFEKLQPLKEGLPKVLLGAEVAYFEGIGNCRDLINMQIGETGLLLVEMPFKNWTDRMVRELDQISLGLGLTPVLAHVDRYLGREQLPKYLEQLLAQGVALQCNADAFLKMGHRRYLLGLVKQGYIRYLGSDTHNLTTRPPRMEEACRYITQKMRTDARDLFDEY